MFLYFILGLAALTATVQNIIKQKFNETCKNSSAYFFSALTAAAAMVLFAAVNIFYAKDWYFTPTLLIPAAGFAISYAAATLFSVLAILHGPLAKTSLIISCSLLIPSLYGILVQGIYIKVIRDGSATLSEALSQALSPTLIIGTVLLFISLFLVNCESKQNAEKDKSFSVKWLVFAILAFLGNGFCSTVQAAKQDFFGNEGNNTFMIAALLMVTVILFLASVLFRSERKNIRKTAQKGWHLAIFCGVANGLTNFFVIFLNANKFPASVLFPVISGGGLLLIFIWSVAVKKERFTPAQYVGYALGVISLVLLNL